MGTVATTCINVEHVMSVFVNWFVLFVVCVSEKSVCPYVQSCKIRVQARFRSCSFHLLLHIDKFHPESRLHAKLRKGDILSLCKNPCLVKQFVIQVFEPSHQG